MRESTCVLVFLFAAGAAADDKGRNNDKISLGTFPTIKYGTAWKKEKTSEYVYQAIQAGFRHIDTACQPKHYNEIPIHPNV